MMKMEFRVADDVNLSDFQVGDTVTFTLKPGRNNQFSAVSLKAKQ